MLYTKDEDQFRPATDSEVVKRYRAIMAARRSRARIKGKTGRPPITERQREQIERALRQGERQVLIAERLGVAQSSVSKIATAMRGSE